MCAYIIPIHTVNYINHSCIIYNYGNTIRYYMCVLNNKVILLTTTIHYTVTRSVCMTTLNMYSTYYSYRDVDHYNAINNTRFNTIEEAIDHLNNTEVSYENLIKAIHNNNAELVHSMLQRMYIYDHIDEIVTPVLNLEVSQYVLEIILNDIGVYLDLDGILSYIDEEYDIDTLIRRSDLVVKLMEYIIHTDYRTSFHRVFPLIVVLAAVDNEDMFEYSIKLFRSSLYDIQSMIDFLEFVDNGDKYSKILYRYR